MNDFTHLQARTAEWCDAHQVKIIALLQQMIQAAAHSEKHVQEVLEAEMKRADWQVEWQSLRTIPWERAPELIRNKPDEQIGQLANLIGRKKGTGGEMARSLLLNGHVDVVPTGDLHLWRDPPFDGICRDGKIYGRGSCDMLGGIVAMWMAMQAILDFNILLRGDVLFTAVVEEECGGAGSAATMLGGYFADAALIAEPTSNRLFTSQQGSQWFRIKVTGKAAHGGTRHHGVSAIELAVEVLGAIKELEQNRHQRGYQERLHDPAGFAYPINVGKIHAGNWPSSVPEEAILEGRYGLMPGQPLHEALAEFERKMAELSMKNPWFETHPVQLEWFGARWMPNELDASHPWHVIWRNLPERHDRNIQAAPWGTDGGWLAHLGQIPVMIYGPGQPEQAHQLNEFIEWDAIKLSICEMVCAICAWCGTDTTEGGN